MLNTNLEKIISPAWNKGSCEVWAWGLEAILIGLVGMYMVLQLVLCVRLFGYASWLDREQRVEDCGREESVLWTIDEKDELLYS